MVNIISHWEWDGDYRKQQICKNNTALAALHTFVFFWEFSFILNNDSTNPFFSPRAICPLPIPVSPFVTSVYSGSPIRKVMSYNCHPSNYNTIMPLLYIYTGRFKIN